MSAEQLRLVVEAEGRRVLEAQRVGGAIPPAFIADDCRIPGQPGRTRMYGNRPVIPVLARAVDSGPCETNMVLERNDAEAGSRIGACVAADAGGTRAGRPFASFASLRDWRSRRSISGDENCRRDRELRDGRGSRGRNSRTLEISAAEEDRPDVAARRAAFQLQQAGLDISHLVFLDETQAKTNMTRLRGRALKGKRLVAKVPHAYWKTTTILAALRSTGLTAPLVVDGVVNGAVFLGYARQQLAPTLSAGDIVIMDNLAAHKVKGVREAIAAVGARVVYLPPYGPNLNPIELVFAKFKAIIRGAAERTVEGLWRLFSQLLDRFTPIECQNDFRHCGYAATAI
jgi:transposase